MQYRQAQRDASEQAARELLTGSERDCSTIKLLIELGMWLALIVSVAESLDEGRMTDIAGALGARYFSAWRKLDNEGAR